MLCDGIAMNNLAKTHSIKLVPEHREVHVSVAGFWDKAAMQDFLQELAQTAAPLAGTGPFSSYSDMREAMPQSREVADMIRQHLEAARERGLSRIAVLDPPALWKLQYDRLSEGLEVAYFKSKIEALAWLRSAD